MSDQLPINSENYIKITKGFKGAESSRNQIGYALSIFFTVLIKLLINQFPVIGETLPDVVILTLSLTLGALTGEAITHRLTEGRKKSQNLARIKSSINQIELKYRPIIAKVEKEIKMLNQELDSPKKSTDEEDLITQLKDWSMRKTEYNLKMIKEIEEIETGSNSSKLRLLEDGH